MKNKLLIILTIVISLFSSLSFAGNDDQDLENAIEQTQKSLNNRNERSKLYNNDDAARGANSMASDAVGGDQNKLDEIYAISGELIPFLAQEANGDPLVMLKILEEAKANPKKFYERFPAAQQAKVKALVDRIDKGKEQGKTRP